MAVEPPAPRLEAVYLYLTGDCNQRCRHCWVDAAHVTRPRTGRPLSVDEIMRALLPARDLGVTSVKISGGEPFLRADAAAIIAALRAADFAVVIETNGTLIDEPLADALARAGVGQISVSLDGATATTHDAFRGQPGAFARTRRAIERLRARELNVQVLTTLTRASAGEIDELLDLCAELDVDSFKLNFLVPMGRGVDLHRRGEALPVRQILEVARHVEQERGPGLPFGVSTALPPAFTPRARLREGDGHVCPIANILGVLDDGRLSLCGIGYLAPELVVGDLRRDSIARVWSEAPLLRQLRDRPHARLQGVCARCILRRTCVGSCRANAFAQHRDLWAPFWLCEEAEREGVFPPARLLQT
ncbi:MAG TPA: radical SAM protein [Polyangia bacterium]|jgi:SynChlorMet cassette radical SAM/SPASM protein ScmF